MKTIATILLILLLSGCSALNVTRTVTFPSGETVEISARGDDLVTIERDGLKATVDGRGRPSMFESLATMMFMKTDFNVSNKEGR